MVAVGQVEDRDDGMHRVTYRTTRAGIFRLHLRLLSGEGRMHGRMGARAHGCTKPSNTQKHGSEILRQGLEFSSALL